MVSIKVTHNQAQAVLPLWDRGAVNTYFLSVNQSLSRPQLKNSFRQLFVSHGGGKLIFPDQEPVDILVLDCIQIFSDSGFELQADTVIPLHCVEFVLNSVCLNS